ncbi:hypothetical protein CK203_041299 [Vitis vinifera]|uniref:Aminotransferase-like plant mobile domain-containing protein n=1 Tax=Vitis vinifera TaxID=29760 RepID=A0A438HJ57_VITVI|nr:hypothetical protein CK203_041299 [Vitis vinifera]
MPSLQDIESMMVGIDDMEEFKRVFLIFACATLLAPTSRLEGSHSLWYTPREQLLGNINWGEYVLEFFIQAIHEHRRKESVWIKGCLMFLQPCMWNLTPRIAAWNDFLVKQRIKLELEMLGGFGKVELVSTLAEQDETEKNKAPAVDDPVDQMRMKTLIRSSEDDLGCTNEGVSERPNVEDGVFFANKDPLHPGPHNMLVLVQSCMDNSADVAPQASEEIRPQRVKIKVRRHRQRAAACKSPFVQLCVSKYKRLTEEETHVADYVFDESKDPSEMLCAYGGYGVTREQLQCLVGESSLIFRCHTGMYAILYMQHWDGSGLNRTINSERMSLERLKFATHMVLDSENEIGEMVTANIWSTNDAE